MAGKRRDIVLIFCQLFLQPLLHSGEWQFYFLFRWKSDRSEARHRLQIPELIRFRFRLQSLFWPIFLLT